MSFQVCVKKKNLPHVYMWQVMKYSALSYTLQSWKMFNVKIINLNTFAVQYGISY